MELELGSECRATAIAGSEAKGKLTTTTAHDKPLTRLSFPEPQPMNMLADKEETVPRLGIWKPGKDPTMGMNQPREDTYLDERLRFSDWPTWDRNKNTAVEFLLRTKRASTWIPGTEGKLARHLTRSFPNDSDIANWYLLLSKSRRNQMDESLQNLVQEIQTSYLGTKWIQKVKDEYRSMTFRQKGQEKEMPREFLQRCLTLVRFLNPGIESPEETHLVVEAMPPAWNAILDRNEVWDTDAFLMQAEVMKRALVESVERK